MALTPLTESIPPWMSRRTIALTVGALVMAVLAGFLLLRGPTVTVVPVETGDAAEVVYATGVVEPLHWAKVTALARRRIVEVCACEGRPVARGEVLVRLDDTQERAALERLQARLDRLRGDAARFEQLVARNVAPRTRLDELRTQISEYEASIRAQEDAIADLQLTAPMDGVVLRRDGEVGEIAGPEDVLMWVGQPTPLQVVAEVNEDDVFRVVPGQTALLRHDGLTGDPLRARVDRLTPKGDPETKTFRVYLALSDNTPLRIGMSVEANVVVAEARDAPLVPAEAVRDGLVQVVIDGRVRHRPVAIAVRGTTAVALAKGPEPGMQVLSPFRAELADGERVRPRSPEAQR